MAEQEKTQEAVSQEEFEQEETQAADKNTVEDSQEEAEGAEENREEDACGQENSDEASEKAGDDKKKKGVFGKKKDKRDEQIEELTDRLRRQMAEFDNFRKRTDKEKSQMYDMGATGVIEKLLPVIDSFERGLAAVPEEEKGSGFAEGMDKIYRQLMTMLGEAGVTPIETEGKEFDPNLHNAVMHVEDESLGENVIAEELQKGYLYKDTVVRHSMVKVAN